MPADDKPSVRLLVAEAILQSLQQYKDIQEPELDEKTKARLDEFKNELENN